MGNINREEDIKRIKQAYRPKIFLPIYTTLICIAPWLHLLLDISDKRYNRLFSLSIISMLGVAYITFMWTSYYYNMKQFKDEIRSYLDNPENYKW